MHKNNELNADATLSHFSIVDPNLIALLTAKDLGLQKPEVSF